MDIVSAIQYGVKGIHWFTYGEYDSPYFGVNTDHDAWITIGNLLQEIKPLTKLLLTQDYRSEIMNQGNLTYSVITNATHKLIAVTNQNYYWNGSETIWSPSIEELELPDGERIDITIEESAKIILLEKTITELEPIFLSFLVIQTVITVYINKKFKNK